MNRLALVRQLSQDAGVNAVGPASTLAQTGIYLQLVQWIDRAYEHIQGIHDTWLFHRIKFSGAMTVGQRIYTRAEMESTFGISNFLELVPRTIKLYLNLADDAEIIFFNWEDFQATYDVGTFTTQTGRPSVWSIQPDGGTIFWPIPEQAYTLHGEYRRTAHKMTADEDVTIFPDEKFDIMIMWRAMMFYGLALAEPDKYSVGLSEYRKLLRGLERISLPKVTLGNPLA